MSVIDFETLFFLIQKQFEEGKEVELLVTGTSMLPFLSGKNKESIIVAKHTLKELKIGHIVMFVQDQKFIFHRIIRIYENLLILQGDGNCVMTEELKPQDVLGLVIKKKKGSRIIDLYTNPKMFLWRIWYYCRPLRKYLLYLYKKLKRLN